MDRRYLSRQKVVLKAYEEWDARAIRIRFLTSCRRVILASNLGVSGGAHETGSSVNKDAVDKSPVHASFP